MTAQGLPSAAIPPTPSAETAVSAAALAEWVRRAEPGQRLVYFTGSALIQSLDVVKEARRLEAVGAVLLTQQRRVDRLFDYQVTRRRNADRPIPARGGIRQGGRPTALVDEESERLLAVLRRLASFARPCPTNAELAKLAALKDGEAVRYRLGLLEKGGRIRIGGPAEGPRVVTIVASGRSTSSAWAGGR